jgi:hypothetical protein
VRLGWKARAAEHTRRFVRAFAHEHFRVHDEVCVASVEGPSSRPGEVLAATSVRLPGGSQGLVQRVRVTRQSAREPVGGRLTRSSSKGPISAAHERAAAEVFRIVREHARARHPGRTRDLLAWDYAWELEVGDEWAPGFALGLPLAIALWSAFFDLPVPQDRCFAGALGADPGLAVPLHGIPFVAERVGGAYDRNLRTLVLPRACACDLADGSDVPAVVVDGLVTWVTTLDDAVRAAFPDAVLEVPVSPRPRDLVAAPR